MERVTECLVTKDEREVIAVVLFSWPIGPTTPDGSVPGTVPPGDNIARTRVMLTADPTRKAPMTHGLLNNSSVAQAQDRERPELTRWLFCGQGIHAERGECPTSAMHIGVRNNFGISALLGLEIGENSLTASKPHSCTSFLNGFSSDPVCAVTPAPEVVFFQAGPLCLRLPMTITPTLGPLCDFSAYLLVYVPAPRVFP
ncbi:hypothetical protein PAPYR_8825 [Paratrimastix pyriformis]|uniref:Uncharacterized protein n=1 Tax=Paratrimastix pyriformis TaxID=342808 RepID=A0ABQ8UDB8_9EUKA|nr:hypothetical protein PAPYR_8825 [Paratrimastix pyriformis]